MSLNRGKAKAKPAAKKATSKAKPKKTTTAATAGIPKRAVMNRRKYNEAISGDTMSNYAMYRAGGKVKKYQAAGVVDAVLSSTERAARQSPTVAKIMSKVGDVAIGAGKAIERAKPIAKKAMDKFAEAASKMERGSKMKKGGSTKTKKFAALAPPYNKVTFADKIAGAKKGSKKKK